MLYETFWAKFKHNLELVFLLNII